MNHIYFFIFQPSFKYIQIFIGTVGKNLGRESKELSEESITTPDRSDNSFAPKPTYIHISKIALVFEGSCLKQNKMFGKK